MAKKDLVLAAVRQLGRPSTEAEIRKHLERQHGGKWTDVRDALSALTANDGNRHHHAGSVDALIKSSVRGNRSVKYWLIDPATGGPAPFTAPPISAQEAGSRLVPDAIYWHVRDAVFDMNRPVTVAEITAWLAQHHPGERYPAVRQDATMLTVNASLRPQFDATRKDYRSDRGHPKDVLYRQGERKTGVTYEPYDVARHGVWDLRPNTQGKWEAYKLKLSPAEQALAEARAEVYGAPPPAFPDEKSARRYELRAIVMREGQPAFKAALVDAYAGQCAVTGCAVLAILEGAHIRPYSSGGAATNVVSNGLLLRSDIHTLFDRGLLWIDAAQQIQLDPELDGSEYAPLHGQALRVPLQPVQRPHPDHLKHHRIHTACQQH